MAIKVTYNKYAKNMHFRNSDDERVNSKGVLADIMFRVKEPRNHDHVKVTFRSRAWCGMSLC